MSAIIKVTVFSDVITLIHHPGSKAFDAICDIVVSDSRNPAAPVTHHSASHHQFRSEAGGLSYCGPALLLVEAGKAPL